MEKGVNSENHLTSAAAFVEGGIQESCDDACSICLEPFSESDPSTITGCKHEFHLQCILEWCQRSSQCPMCWQPISLKDPSSQELLDAIEQEKIVRASPSRNTTIFHHPTLGDFELQHLPATRNNAELEERILQHLAAAAAMGRVRHIARREGQRSRSSAQGRPHFVVFSTAPNAPPVAPLPSSPTHRGDAEPAAAVTIDVLTSPLMALGEDSTQLVPQPSTHCGTSSNNQRSTSQSSPTCLDGAGPSDFQSFSESLKSRFNAISMRYKESITKSTRGWKERLFSRSTNTADLGSDLSREVNAGIATVPHLVERLEIRDNSDTNIASILNDSPDSSVPDPGNQQIAGQASSNCLKEGNIQAPCVTSSASD